MATIEGSFMTMPSPRTYTRVLAVPRSMARSLEKRPARKLSSMAVRSHLVATGSIDTRRRGESNTYGRAPTRLSQSFRGIRARLSRARDSVGARHGKLQSFHLFEPVTPRPPGDAAALSAAAAGARKICQHNGILTGMSMDDLEVWFDKGVTDGLPGVAPARERGERML